MSVASTSARESAMPSSTTRSISDVEEFREEIRPSDTEYLVTEKGRFSATVTKINLTDLWMQRLTESLARTWQIASSASRIAILFPAGPGSTMSYRGVELARDEVGFVTKDMDVWHHASGDSQFASLSLPEEAVARESMALFGRDLTPPRNSCLARLPSASMARLRRLHGAITSLAETAPDIIANCDAAKGIEASLTEAFFDCLSTVELREDQAAQRQHFAIVKRLYELGQEHPGKPLYVADVCKALGISQRTLHYSCFEQLGIGPKQYLLLRRLHLAHLALRRASPAGASVTQIAMGCGFWELGRFAVMYRSTFGETPSATLHGRGASTLRWDP
jgi:AraC-like DNA-binding protein